MRVAGVAVALILVMILIALPPRTQQIDLTDAPPVVRGVMHVHTVRSDGTGTLDTVARAAASAGLQFVVVTDHGDGTRIPDAPAYLHGVLILDAVEVSSTDGHVVALGMSQAPYPLGGEARDVVADVHRLGGMAIAAHPGSPKPGLEWSDWEVPVDGLEWVNADSEWRDEGIFGLLRVLMTYAVRPREALTTLLDRPTDVFMRWDSLAATRPVVGLSAPDAHARIGVTSLGEPYDSRASVPVPSYAVVFSAMSMALDGVSLVGDPKVDADAVVGAIRTGRVYTTIDGLAAGGRLTFSATSADLQRTMGEHLLATGPVRLQARAVAPPGARLTLYRNGQVIREVDGSTLDETVSPEPGSYRVEIGLPTASGTPPVPWMVSNPIYVGTSPAPTIKENPEAPRTGRRTLPIEIRDDVRIERSAGSTGAASLVPAGGGEVLFRYALGGRMSEHPYAAMVLTLAGPLVADGAIRFIGRADKPMRLSVQLRSPDSSEGVRWQRSVYLDETPRVVVVPLGDLKPVGSEVLSRGLAFVDALLFVVDAVHTPLGRGGRVWLKDVALDQPPDR